MSPFHAVGWPGTSSTPRDRKPQSRRFANWGGSVQYDWELDDPDNPFRVVGNASADELPERTRTCLCKLFGQDFVSDAVCVDLKHWQSGTHATICDADLVHFRDLPQLQLLGLSSAKITNAGLASLEGLTRLEKLDLSSTQIADAGLEHLQGLTRLRELRLAETNVTDAGLEYLQGLSRLETLDLWGTPITDAGLEHLQGLTQLKALFLCHTQVTNEGLERLKTSNRLETLELLETWADESGVANFKAELPDVKVTFSTRLAKADREAIRMLLDRSAEFRGLSVVSMDPVIGGGVEVCLTVRPHFSGPCLLLRKRAGKWEIADSSRVWIGEPPSE